MAKSEKRNSVLISPFAFRFSLQAFNFSPFAFRLSPFAFRFSLLTFRLSPFASRFYNVQLLNTVEK